MKRTYHVSSKYDAPAKRTKTTKATSQVARQAAKNVLMRMAETKTKWQHVNEINLSTLTGYLAYDPLAPTQGTGPQERIGTEIQPTGLHIRGVVHNNGGNANFVRILVVKSTTRQDIASGDFFAAASGIGQDITAINGVDRVFWPIHQKVHKVLYDKTLLLEKSTEINKAKSFNKFIKLSGKVKFDGASTGPEQVTPRYHIVYLGAESPDDTSLGENVEVSALHRFFYKDF